MKQSEPWTQTARTALWNPSSDCGVHYPPALQQCCRSVRPPRPHGKVVYSASSRTRCILVGGSNVSRAAPKGLKTLTQQMVRGNHQDKDTIANGSEDRRPSSKRGETRGSSHRRRTGTYRRRKFPLRPALLVHDLHGSFVDYQWESQPDCHSLCQMSFVRSL